VYDAGKLGRGGERFILKSFTPRSKRTLAKQRLGRRRVCISGEDGEEGAGGIAELALELAFHLWYRICLALYFNADGMVSLRAAHKLFWAVAPGAG